jgi:hypothetical protein
MNNGRVTVQGTPEHVMNTPEYKEYAISEKKHKEAEKDETKDKD